jgi:DMSO reductase family type II enzyme chaperone
MTTRGVTVVRGLEDEAAMWKVLHDLFRLPTEPQWRWLHEQPTQRAFALLANGPELRLPDTYAEYEQEYLAAFEVGLPHPPAPLIESHWRRSDPPPRVLHQNLLFYRRFGLDLRRPSAENADHLRCQLELMCHLCRLELRATADAKADEASQLARARTDFSERHLASWIPQAAAALEREAPESWPSRWLALLERCCATGSGEYEDT